MNRRYILRRLALSCTTVFGIWFLADASGITWVYLHNHFRFPLFITRWDLIGTVVLGFAFMCSGALYLRLAREAKPRV
jgi:hypothetical protein